MNAEYHAQSDSTSLVAFNFHGDMLDVATTPDGEHWVVLARLCEPFDLDVDGQRRKLVACQWATTKIILAVAADGKAREVFGLNIRSVAGWLFTVNAGKVAEHLREKLARYQRECADVLADHFLGRRGSHSLDAAAIGAALAPFARGIEALAGAVAEQSRRIEALEQRGSGCGIVGPAVGGHIRLELRRLAGILHRCGRVKSKASALTRLSNQLRGAVGWAGTGCSWDCLPTAQHAAALRELDVMRRTAEGIAEALNTGRQTVLPLRVVRPGDPA